jgi:gamma-glutamyltranspeptidase/glutathione hydrolase
VDPLDLPFPSRRVPLYARQGMVATAQALAAQAGLEILQLGGNAVDAAVATAAALTVVEPTSNGIGGDAFALVWTGRELVGLNASGPAPRRLDAVLLERRGLSSVPPYGWDAVTVPGAPAAWAWLTKRFGRLPLTRTLAPAVRYAEAGYPVSAGVAADWAAAARHYRMVLPDALAAPWYATFAPGGEAPKAGDLIRFPDHAQTLVAIAESGAESFYRGALAERIVAYAQATGGYFAPPDLAEYAPEWVAPLTCTYRGYTVAELPPNSQGVVALLALALLGEQEPLEDPLAESHRAIEAVKAAFVDSAPLIADPRSGAPAADRLLDPEQVRRRAKTLGATASDPDVPGIAVGGTVYLATADQEGMMVSYIQSNYLGFGSGLVVPGTGVALQNRGACFTLDPAGWNRLAGGRRPYHTIIPGFLLKDGQAVAPFGVMGGFMQPQGHVQVLLHLLDAGRNPQAALDAPRWRWVGGRRVEVEPGFPAAGLADLTQRGHEVVVSRDIGRFGRGQVIWREPHGVLVGATDPRADGQVAVF